MKSPTKASRTGLLASEERNQTLGLESFESAAQTVYDVDINGYNGPGHSSDDSDAQATSEPGERILPLNAIHVRSDIRSTLSTREGGREHNVSANMVGESR